MANDYTLIKEMKMSPGKALELATQANLYADSPAGRDSFFADLNARTADGSLSPRQRQLVDIAREHYVPFAQNRWGQKAGWYIMGAAGVALASTLMVGSITSSSWQVKEQQHRMEQKYNRAVYLTGHTPFNYNSNKSLEANLKDVQTDAQKDREGGRGVLYLLGGLGLLAGLLGLTGYKLRARDLAQRANRAAGAGPNPKPTAPVPPAPALPAPTPVPVLPAPAVPALPGPAPNPLPPYGANP
ncbi:Uncharacterised protein [uncultured archaeon]|nr:Uncharacterised protein [uncultured archaeon]